jgi:hypothetical protein
MIPGASVMQTGQHWCGNKGPTSDGSWCASFSSPKRVHVSLYIEKGQDSFQMPFAEDQGMIQAAHTRREGAD